MEHIRQTGENDIISRFEIIFSEPKNYIKCGYVISFSLELTKPWVLKVLLSIAKSPILRMRNFIKIFELNKTTFLIAFIE